MSTKNSTLRIIGGKWRSRKIKVACEKNIRPTTNMARETLFNWLDPYIAGASCLDLFAGSGALGFEALSRGAKHVVMVDAAKKVITQLKATAKSLETENIEFYHAKIPEQLNRIPEQPFDIVFLDPPFYKNLAKLTCEKLEKLGHLTKDAMIYLEIEKNLDLENIIPRNWQTLRQKNYGSTSICLLQRVSNKGAKP